jgi:hypothetical protein
MIEKGLIEIFSVDVAFQFSETCRMKFLVCYKFAGEIVDMPMLRKMQYVPKRRGF